MAQTALPNRFPIGTRPLPRESRLDLLRSVSACFVALTSATSEASAAIFVSKLQSADAIAAWTMEAMSDDCCDGGKAGCEAEGALQPITVSCSTLEAAPTADWTSVCLEERSCGHCTAPGRAGGTNVGGFPRIGLMLSG